MTATNIQIMEEMAEIKTLELIAKASVCTNRSDRCNRPARPVYMALPTGHRSTGPTGSQDRTDRSPPPPPEIDFQANIVYQSLNPNHICDGKKI